MRRSVGITLTELLVVVAIIAALSAMMVPVFHQGILAAKTSHCVQNFHQIGKALAIYQSDYDQKFPPVNYVSVNLADTRSDRSWVQTLLPYVGHYGPFVCPSDTGRTQNGGPPARYAQEDPWRRYYEESLRSNLGYNYLYLSPLLKDNRGTWRAWTKSESAIARPSSTIVFIDSVWDRTEHGIPTGGGSWVTVPPCRYRLVDERVVDTFNFPSNVEAYFGFQPVGWQPESSKSWLVYGGAWPWHNDRFNTLYADGSAHTLLVSELIAGCDFRENWRGFITSPEDYIWDLD